MKKLNEIAVKITNLREDAGWSQSELAKRSGVTSSAISMIENGLRSPSLIVIRKISEAFKMSVSEITGEKPLQKKNEAQVFFRKFEDLDKLPESDQRIIQDLIQSLKDKK
jgi:transcriptional regulator with XRE-family HTH domain